MKSLARAVMARAAFKCLVLVLAVVVAHPASSSLRCDDRRGIWTRFASSSAVVMARCGPMDENEMATCAITRRWKGAPGCVLRVNWRGAMVGTKPSGPDEQVFFTLGSSADSRAVLTIVHFASIVVPPEEVDALARYLDDYVRLDSMKDRAARNVAYWTARADWLEVEGPFIHAEVVRDVTGTRSPWGDRIPDLAMGVDMALACTDPVRHRLFSMVIRETRDNPTDHNQLEVVRLLEGDAAFASAFLDRYPAARFPRDAVFLLAIERLANATSGVDPLIVKAARGAIEDLLPWQDLASVHARRPRPRY